jgi:chaperone modulatory protein CbpM
MQSDIRDVLWLDQVETVSITELAGLSGLSEADVRDLVDLGALAPANPGDAQWTFSANCVVTMRRACRLRTDLELDMHAVALALTLIEQINRLETELAQLRAQQPQRRD